MKSWALIGLAIGLFSSVAFSSGAYAADWYTGAPVEQSGGGLFSSDRSGSSNKNFGAAVDLSVVVDTKDSQFLSVIGTIAPFTGLDETGMRLRLSGVFGQYSYIGSNGIGRVRGRQSDGSFMVGYEWVSTRTSIAIYAGADYNDNRIDKFDPSNNSVGSRVGGKVAADFTYRPSAFTMFAGYASFSSAHSAYYGKLKMGFAVAPEVFVGPELTFLGDEFFRQWRIGGHISGVKLGPVQFGAGVGFLSDRVRGTGLYGGFDARVAF